MSGRIPQQFIQDLLSRTDIVQVIGDRLELKKKGREYVALSPFTSEKTPSFTVSPAKQFYHCFSSGQHGTAITFLMEYDRLNFVDAVEELARKAGLEVPREGGAPAPARLDQPRVALERAGKWFRERLKDTPVAVDYLKGRGVTGETARTFGLGFAPDEWDGLAKQFKDPGPAVTAGLLVKKDNGRTYDRFRHRVMFPIRDARGRIIGFGGRALGDDPAKYLNSPETPLFHKGRHLYGLFESRQSDARSDHLLVVEGYMDVVMLAQHGVDNAVATLGTATTREHLQQLFRTTTRVVFCFDGDRAGKQAAWRALEQALPEIPDGKECLFMFMPEKQDPDDVVRAEGAPGFRARVEQAQPMSGFLLDGLSRQVNLGTPDGRARLAALARPMLSKMRDGMLRKAIADEFARVTRLEPGDLLEPGPVPAPPPRPQDRDAPAPSEPMARTVRRALQLLLERPALAGQADPEAFEDADMAGLDLLADAVGILREHPETPAGQLLERWRDHPRHAEVNRLAARGVELVEDALEREFRDAIQHLSRRSLRTRAQRLIQRARERDLTEDEQRELEGLTREWSGHPHD